MMMTIEEVNNLSRDDYTQELYDLMLDTGIATADEMSLVAGISGWNPEIMNGILYYKLGLRDLSQLLDEYGMLEEEEEY